ncbi:MAG: hypothetical protein F6K30_18520 [Cyanothece sp. SIO2G6]|nr:hypothetical protein [Cyanothece sp. SIO2G6]
MGSAEIMTRSLVGDGNGISRNHYAIAGGEWEWDQPKSLRDRWWGMGMGSAEIITRSLVGDGNGISRNHYAIAGGGWEWDQSRNYYASETLALWGMGIGSAEIITRARRSRWWGMGMG